jgi:predicted PurR-regulated permease PerM
MPMTPQTQERARWSAAALLIALGIWTLHGFLMPIAWAIVLSLTLWPLYDVIRRRLASGPRGKVLAALGMSLALGILLYGPVSYGLIRVLKEMQSLTGVLHIAQQDGLTPPLWLGSLPLVGTELLQLWDQWLGSPEAFRDMGRVLVTSNLPEYTRLLAGFVVHRLASAFFTIVVFFFILLNADLLKEEVLKGSDRLFGPNGDHYVRHAASAVRATVNGIVLVAIGQGVALGFGFQMVGFAHSALLGVLTGLIALIPFAAKIMSLGAALVLITQGAVATGIGFLAYGLVTVILADNYVKPKLIGNQVHLPFIWTLLGILGGIESFGLLGLFLGPTIMAVLISVWRDSQDSRDRTA